MQWYGGGERHTKGSITLRKAQQKACHVQSPTKIHFIYKII